MKVSERVRSPIHGGSGEIRYTGAYQARSWRPRRARGDGDVIIGKVARPAGLEPTTFRSAT